MPQPVILFMHVQILIWRELSRVAQTVIAGLVKLVVQNTLGTLTMVLL